ncbi:hypothetical protein TNCV_3675931 [Trichonephila clavipes]|nr:hypothetical protein TNCV_3675931 [Trichonephila clavipes]
MTPQDVFKDLCGIIFTGESRNVFTSREYFVCVELVSTSRSPNHNLLTDIGSPPIPLRALCIANGDFRDMALLGKIINKNLTRLAVVGQYKAFTLAQPTWIHIREKTSSFWRGSTHHRIQQGRQYAGHLVNTRHCVYLVYTQNIMLQHQGEDPTGKPDTPYLQTLTLQQCLFGDTEERCHQPIDRSGLTPATRLQ